MSFTWEELNDLGHLCASNKKNELALKCFLESTEDLLDSDNKTIQSLASMAAISLEKRETLDWCINRLLDATKTFPEVYHYWINLATAYIKIPNLVKAKECIAVAMALNPNEPYVYSALSTINAMEGNYEEECKAAGYAAERDPLYKYQFGMTLAKTKFAKPNGEIYGDDETSDENKWHGIWDLYDTRDRPFKKEFLTKITTPHEFSNKRVYVVQEQGLGDFFMCAQAFRWLRSLGAEVHFISNNEQLIEVALHIQGVTAASKPPFKPNAGDIVITTMDLLRWRHKWAVDDPTKFEPYLNVAKDPGFKHSIIVNQTGNPDFPFEYVRGIYDENINLKKILTDYAVSYKYFVDEVITSQELMAYNYNLLQTARAVKACDLVVTTDSMLSHLAGAVGTPCITLLCKMYDWRWSYNWYGKHTLIVQDEIGKWDNAIQSMLLAVKKEFD